MAARAHQEPDRQLPRRTVARRVVHAAEPEEEEGRAAHDDDPRRITIALAPSLPMSAAPPCAIVTALPVDQPKLTLYEPGLLTHTMPCAAGVTSEVMAHGGGVYVPVAMRAGAFDCATESATVAVEHVSATGVEPSSDPRWIGP